jgi:epoxyqueuosine reductase
VEKSAVESISGLFASHGLDIVGICDDRDLPNEEAQYREWLALGYHGTMQYLENHTAAKYRPGTLLEGCRSLIFSGLNYYQPRGEVERGHGLIARFAWGRDYHNALGKRLKRIAKRLGLAFPGHRFLAFTDATPLAERSFAVRAGAGFVGRNTLLIRRGVGSFFVLGGIASTLDILGHDLVELEQPKQGGLGRSVNPAGCPAGCTRCIDACPTGALLASHRMDARLCISYLTIENRGSIPAHLRERMGAWIFGCDACQEACPFNQGLGATGEEDFLAPNAGPSIAIRDILCIESQDRFAERFSGSSVMRAKRAGMIRNACVAAANLGLVELCHELERLSSDSDSIIADHARWALLKLRPGHGLGSTG